MYRLHYKEGMVWHGEVTPFKWDRSRQTFGYDNQNHGNLDKNTPNFRNTYRVDKRNVKASTQVENMD